jgi:hypothetical protein
MSIFLLTTGATGQEGVYPRTCKLVTSDDLATVTTAGYLNPSAILPQVIYPSDFFTVSYGATNPQNGTSAEFTVSITNGTITLVPY